MTHTGVVKTFLEKGYGFISPDAGRSAGDIFFHINDLEGDWEPNAQDRVSYTVGTDRLGRPYAQQVRIIEP